MIIDYAVRIGIFYKDKQWAELKCEEIYKDIINRDNSGTCLRYKKNVDTLIIELGNGSYIKFLPADDRSRGNKFNRIYYQEGIDEEVLNYRIYPMLFNLKPEPLR